jgi:putative transposase
VIGPQAFRYELAPKAGQWVLLAKHAGCARFAWNWSLGERIFRNARSESARSSLSRDRCAITGRYRECKAEERFTNAIEQHRELTARKSTEWPWMYEVSKCAPQEALRDLDRAFRNFVRARRVGRAFGFPPQAQGHR